MAKAKKGKDAPAPAPAAPPAPDAGRLSYGLTRLVNTLGGASLVFGEPIEVEGRKVVPVARVRGAGGVGYGHHRGGDADDDGGGGGGGAIEASPAGFLDITADGVRYEAIPDPITTARALSTGASALTLLVSAVLGVRRIGRRRSVAALLERH